jgi:uracil-DNA glycosylase
MDVRIEPSWKQLLINEFNQPYFESLAKFVKQEYASHPNGVFPRGDQIFKAFDACPIENVKVVILGQDPYPTRGHAHGLCFSVEQNIQPLPRSLQNIYKELNSDLGNGIPENGNLVHWAEQGVLLLNSVLTVREGHPDSHAKKGWELFTDAVIQCLNQNKTELVYILWGSKAQRKAENVNLHNNLILMSPHPSPLSASRGFFGCRHFSKANNYLISKDKTAINW